MDNPSQELDGTSRDSPLRSPSLTRSKRSVLRYRLRVRPAPLRLELGTQLFPHGGVQGIATGKLSIFGLIVAGLGGAGAVFYGWSRRG